MRYLLVYDQRTGAVVQTVALAHASPQEAMKRLPLLLPRAASTEHFGTVPWEGRLKSGSRLRVDTATKTVIVDKARHGRRPQTGSPSLPSQDAPCGGACAGTDESSDSTGRHEMRKDIAPGTSDMMAVIIRGPVVRVPFDDGRELVVKSRPMAHGDDRAGDADHEHDSPQETLPEEEPDDTGGTGEGTASPNYTDVTVRSPYPVYLMAAQPGCLSCSGPPKITLDLAGRHEDTSPKVPDCDGKRKEEIRYEIKWRNTRGGETEGEKYTERKAATDASVYAHMQVWDSTLAVAQAFYTFVTQFVPNITKSGLGSLDDEIRRLENAVDALLNGKLDADVLLGEVEWVFKVHRRATISVRQTHFWESFIKKDGVYRIRVRTTIDGDEVGLELPDQAKRTQLQETNGRFKKAAEYSALRTEGGKELTASTHTLKTTIDLKAGYNGIGTDANRKTLEDLLKAATDAARAAIEKITAWIEAAVGDGGTAPNLEDLKSALKTALDVAKKAAAALLALITSLTVESKAYVRLYSSDVKLTCDPGTVEHGHEPPDEEGNEEEGGMPEREQDGMSPDTPSYQGFVI